MRDAIILLATLACLPGPAKADLQHDIQSLRLAVTDLAGTFGPRYRDAERYLAELDALARAPDAARLAALRDEALLANPLLDFDRLILLKRKRGQLGLPTNHECNASLKPLGYDNEIAVLSPVHPSGSLHTLYRPEDGAFVGEIDLHFDAQRLLFSMPVDGRFQIHEIRADGSGLRQISRDMGEGVHHFDACYLPNGRIVLASTASFHAVPCWHGARQACALYIMDTDGGNVRQLCFDQDHDFHPSVLPSGQVIYSRWDYSGTMHMYLRPLMVMDPDGTGQRAVYGSNSYWPNALYYPRGTPGHPGKLIAVIAGYHGVHRMGELGLIDTRKGAHEAEGVVQRVPGRGRPVEPIIKDNLVDASWPKSLHPFPVSDKHFIVAMQPDAQSPWGIYLVDVFDNIVALKVDPALDLLEPIPLEPQPRPPIVPDSVDLTRDDAVVYLHDVYAGPGLAGVPRGTIRSLRVLAYHFGYPGMAGPDKIGCGGPWEVMRILGTVRVHGDGSAMFRVPANTPLSVQPLDAEGKAVQLMRSWFTCMPGETLSCVGCHERASDAPVGYALAATKEPVDIEPWYGPPRGFDFEREVQPVLDRHCMACHDRSREDVPDLRAEHHFPGYTGRPLTKLGADRLHADVKAALDGTRVRYTTAYESLIPYIRRVGIEDDVRMLVPGEYHADTSELVQILMKGHHGVRLDRQAWDRLITWIDLNAPCHGTWSEVAPIPDRAHERRMELRIAHRGPRLDPEIVPGLPRPAIEPIRPSSPPDQAPVPRVPGWPFPPDEARQRQAADGPARQTLDLGDGVELRLVRIPAGEFVMGDPNEPPMERASIAEPLWLGACELTNEQFRLFSPDHRTKYFMKRYPGRDGPGLSLDAPKQPVIRVSWNQAMGFCEWLSERTGRAFTLPTEPEWEYACRAGSATAMHYGDLDADFSRFANMADAALSVHPPATGGMMSNITQYQGFGGVFGGDVVCDRRFDDNAIATSEVGSYAPNPWSLYDMHGNVAEWTFSAEGDRRVVRGGSFVDRPRRCRSAFRLSYPAWQSVHNVGFRVAMRP